MQISSKQLRGALCTILMIDSVKSIATNPLCEPFIRTRVHSGRLRQSAVKASVEHGHLENRAHALLDDLDPLKLGSTMKRCKGGHARDCRFHFWCDGGCFVYVLAPEHDAMTYYVDFGRIGKDT